LANNQAVDEDFIRRCLQLAARAEGQTAPNPLVGCVVLDKNGKVVGEGFHPRAGESHAEVFALDQAGEQARRGTLYSSLEPCCHHGRTPPCSDRVIKSGVSRVVIGIGDPNPKVEGGGIKALREAGLDVVVGVLENECRYQNRGFLKALQKGLPWLALKMAVTLDGKIADRDGKSRWISGPEARNFVMQLRRNHDAILIGAGTARGDDPSLTVRLEGETETKREGAADLNLDLETKNIRAKKNPVRVIVDSRLSLSPSARVFAPGDGSLRTIVFCGDDNGLHKQPMANFPKQAQVIAVAGDKSSPADAAGYNRLDLRACLEELKQQGMNLVLCEGGGRLAGSLIDQGLVDEVYWFVAPKIMADERSPAAVRSPRARPIGEALNIDVKEQRIMGPDVLIHGLVHKP
jgi:diaminohydroxyphosphoribosylaminopyrimidine deaminase/5-amino-6-(5-phosphoribosylamino)uracil reductase